MGTALIYDEEMTRYKLLWVDPACKIEVPERLTVSHEALIKNGLADRCVSVPVREATDADILLVHSEEYLEAVKKTPYMTLEDLKEFTLQYGDVYFHPNIYHCAKLAAGAALQLVDSVMTGKVRNGMALVRPPGHHSMSSAANGFCVFNNVAIAAQYAKQKYGLKRVLIVDWDVHHGQGVQYCFEDDPSVLYFSWHRYEHQKFWPQLRESDYDSVGKEKGAGFNINVPWNKVGMKNSDYLSVFCHVLLPVAYEFCPDLVLVCAGFDSAIGDPEGEMCASPDIFAHLTHLLMNLAGGKLCAVLEGGYNLTSLPQSVCQTVQTLLGDPAPRPANLDGPCESALESLHCVRSAHRQYWSCLKHAAKLPTFEISTKRVKLAEEEERLEKGDEEKSQEEQVWPEPPKRVTPPIRAALVLPNGVACPDGCESFGASEDADPVIVNKLRENFVKDADDCHALTTLSSLISLVEKMEKNEGCSDASGFLQAVLGLLLPLGYEYDPSLVLLVRMPDSGVCDSVWQQLTGLLQGLAQGHTLVLMQEGEKERVAPTASALLGDAAPSLGQLHSPLPEDVEVLERLRHRLQGDWKLLQTTAPETGRGDEH
ncbi:polyamine deacetylase HDAC10 isoform X2 [Dicentrarchus labrax]|uniref:polyamine deacetylase HDAC10 isoform X2 n=1 Tax=Dicentrarchus labrax TaxID=13489 RepID=UPI0021F6813F|nr:polyamine deacetylase HDAC10 isoform X2 [Dicentrarchus labrax]